MNVYSLLADLVVIVHGAYVGFVVFGLVAVLVGYLLRWQWVRNFWFRTIHLGMILVVVFEALAGIVCPLTTLENYLRDQAGQPAQSGTFMGQVVRDLLFYDAPQWVFTCAYSLFATLVLASFWLVPVRRRV